MTRFALTVSALLVSVALPAIAQHSLGTSRVSLEVDWGTAPDRSNKGFAGCSLRVTNHEDRARTYTIRINHLDINSGQIIYQREVSLQAGGSAELHMPVLAVTGFPTQLSILLDGSIEDEVTVPGAIFNVQTEKTHAVLTDQAIDLGSAYARLPDTPSRVLPVVRLASTKWSEHWEDFSAFDLLVLTRASRDRLSIEQARALDRFVRCGGVLWIHDDAEVEASPAIRSERVGFGMIYHIGAGVADAGEEAKRFLLARSLSMKPFAGLEEETPWARRIPIDEEEVPIRVFFLPLLLLALLIGPVNLWFLHRRNKRIWLIWTTPLISLVAAGLVALGIFLVEGFTTRTHLESITLLDQENNLATTIGSGGVYSTGNIPGGLVFPDGAVIDPDYETLQRKGLMIQRDRDITFGRGWIRPRIPMFYRVRQVETRRERLVATRVEEGLRVLNGLGADLGPLYLADEEGLVYHLPSLAAGGTAIAVEVDPLTRPPDTTARMLYTSDWDPLVWSGNGDAGKIREMMTAGSFVAVVTNNPFFGPHLREKATEVVSHGLIIGDLEVAR